MVNGRLGILRTAQKKNPHKHFIVRVFPLLVKGAESGSGCTEPY
jgi:hypothetical protein